MDPRQRKISVTLLDTKTGRRVKTGEEHSSFFWAEGNGSCDCNRCHYFPGSEDEIRENPPYDEEDYWVCFGCNRFLIVEAPADIYTLREFNQDYPEELLAQHLPT